jgi:hypothetical protein
LSGLARAASLNDGAASSGAYYPVALGSARYR